MQGNFITNIQASYPLFTKAERKVADYIIGNTQKVLFMSITDLASACRVGDTSVFRFCKTMKLQGYQEFKMKLSLGMNEEAGTTMSMGKMPINLEDSLEDITHKVLQNSVNAISETHSLLNPEEIARAIDYFEKAGRVYFFGVGSSMVTALAAMNKFLRITPKVQCVQDAHMQAMMASILSEDDLAFIISYSGATKDTIHVARQAKEAGAKVACITRHEKSPLTSFSDVTILCGANEGPLEGGSTSAQMSELYLIDVLYMEYYKKKYDISNENNQKTSSAVLGKLY